MERKMGVGSLVALVLTALVSMEVSAVVVEEAAWSAASATFQRAAGGDKAVVQQALTQFEQLAQRYPGHPVVEARMGSLITMQARDAWTPWNKMRYAERGLERIDAALDALESGKEFAVLTTVPTRFDVVLTAASTFTNMPRFFNRWGQAQRLLSEQVAHADFTTAPAGYRAEVWLLYGRLEQQLGHDRPSLAYLHQAVAADPKGAGGRQAAALLRETGHE